VTNVVGLAVRCAEGRWRRGAWRPVHLLVAFATRPKRGIEERLATTNDLKNGMVLSLDGVLWTVVKFQHVKPGKGGAFVRTTLKNVLSGKVVDKTFNAGTKVDTATVDKRTMQFLYADDSDYIFMDMGSFEQIN